MVMLSVASFAVLGINFMYPSCVTLRRIPWCLLTWVFGSTPTTTAPTSSFKLSACQDFRALMVSPHFQIFCFSFSSQITYLLYHVFFIFATLFYVNQKIWDCFETFHQNIFFSVNLYLSLIFPRANSNESTALTAFSRSFVSI